METDSEGLLVVTNVVRGKSHIKRNGTVCNLNWHSANLFCQSLGFIFAELGSADMKDDLK